MNDNPWQEDILQQTRTMERQQRLLARFKPGGPTMTREGKKPDWRAGALTALSLSQTYFISPSVRVSAPAEQQLSNHVMAVTGGHVQQAPS